MRWARSLVLVRLMCVLAAAPTAAALRSTPGVGGFIETPRLQVSISRDQVSTRLGESFSFDLTDREHGHGDLVRARRRT